MANEISVNLILKAAKGYLSLDRRCDFTPTLNGSTASVNFQSIGTSNEQINIGSDVTTAGFFYFRNCDATNFVTIGVLHSAVFVPLIKLKPGEASVGRLATSAVYALADTASVVLECTVLND